MGWILLVAFQSVTFSVAVDTRAECEALGQFNQTYWQQSGQQATAVCMTSFEV